jgi:hypothetical protein
MNTSLLNRFWMLNAKRKTLVQTLMVIVLLSGVFSLQAQSSTRVVEKMYIAGGGFTYIPTDNTLNLKGNITTVRSTTVANRGMLSFAGTATWISDNGSFVNGYVRSHKTDAFTFPIGQGTYRPARISAASDANPTDAAYYNTAQYSSTALDSDIEEIRDESWIIQGSTSAIITLSWSTDISSFADELCQLTIVGWDGAKWTKIASAVDATSPIFGTASLLTTTGSLSTKIAIDPDSYSAYSIGVFETLEQDDPVDVTICYDATHTFNVAEATGGNGTILYQWEQSSDGLAWSNATGTNTNAAYTTPILTSDMYYRRIAKDDSCEITSEKAKVTINDCGYTVYGTVFPFVYIKDDDDFNDQFITTVKLFHVPSANVFDKIGYIRKAIPVFTEVVTHYNCEVDEPIFGAPLNPGEIGQTNNPGLPIRWQAKGITNTGVVDVTTTNHLNYCVTSPIGKFRFENVPSGEYVIEVARQGFLTRYGKITVSSNAYIGHREILAGDVNSDNVIDVKDLSAFQTKNALFGFPAYIWKNDLNGDKKVDNNDLELIRVNLNSLSTIYEEAFYWLN